MTDQLQATLKSNQTVADIDRPHPQFSRSGYGRTEGAVERPPWRGVEISLLLRTDSAKRSLVKYRLQGRRVLEEPIGLLEISDDSLKDMDGYSRIARRVCGESVKACLSIATDGNITGALIAAAKRALQPIESKQLNDLADRMSVAITNIQRSETLFQKAHFDELTGLINRHAFQEKLREHISRSWRGENGAVLFIDLDGFKKVNDTEGHKAGDRLADHHRRAVARMPAGGGHHRPHGR